MHIDDLQQQRDVQHLKDGLDSSGFSFWDLWLKYFSLGGEAGELEVEAHLNGKLPLPEFQRTLLRLALDELGDGQTVHGSAVRTWA